MTAFHFEEFSNAGAAQPMLAILFVFKPVNNHSTASTTQHIHFQLVGLQKHFDTDKSNRREGVVRLSKRFPAGAFTCKSLKDKAFIQGKLHPLCTQKSGTRPHTTWVAQVNRLWAVGIFISYPPLL